ncbi:sugar ABC transporter ATP-binding protein [Rhodobacter sp. KR11]|uniref:sugar ABC transporter ATP-binding protein n=1 Tax=Rhodobacter sp. KR11 TaxID=2974588 RepID=UPI0022237698|nr:sugar ABC transporter ATP-binding protein [Rhodobacter sp. KR11]MCW1919015.1 sugar ABC transporter ATP-binding protein [Rhodobacter sp. KR11]
MSRLSISGVEKSFGALKVLHGVSMTVEPGEVHGLLGENGAGKSTLLNILCGVLSPDRGTVQIDGRPVTITSPRAASEAGIAMIHQELQQVPELTVAQNIFLGANLRRGPFTARAAQEAEARRLLAPLDPTIDVTAPVKSLRVAARQLVEIAKALRARAKIIAMDEPTSSLTPAEFEKLAQVVQKLTAEGVSVIYVSHKMDEVFRLCHSATILRDGRFIERVKLPETPVAQVIAKMVGRELVHATHVSYAKPKVILQAQGLTGGPVRDVSFTLHQGEVLGIAGLVGSGRTELLRIIAGVDSSTGSLTLNGQAPGQGPRARIAAGLGLLPEERKRDGIIRHRPVTTNVGLASMKAFTTGGLIAKRRLHARTEALMKDVGLRPLDVTKPIGQFSGGNQQKAIIGRWLAADTQVFLFDEPTRGIDVGAKAEIYALIERLAAEGRSVIVVSSEMPEVIRLSDRVMVMREGRISATLSGPDITEANIAHNAIPA